MEKRLWFEEWYCPIKAVFSGMPFVIAGIGAGMVGDILPEDIKPIVAIPSIAMFGYGIYTMYRSYRDCKVPYVSPEPGDLKIEFTYPVEGQEISRPFMCLRPSFTVYNLNRKKIKAYSLHIMLCLDTWESWKQEGTIEFPDVEEYRSFTDPCSWWPGGIFIFRPGNWLYEIQVFSDENRTNRIGSWQVRFKIV